MTKENLNKIIFMTILVAIGVAVGAATVYSYPQVFSLAKNNNSNQNSQNILSVEAISEKLIKFINEQILQGSSTASILSITEEGNLYKVKLKIEEQEFDTYATKDGKLLFPQFINLDQESAQEQGKTIGDFSVSTDDLCQENSKPIVYFFGSSSCPHCIWEHPIVEKVANSFGDLVSFHSNIEFETDQNVFGKYSTGSIPTLVLGCKYYRVGSGESSGEEEETKNLTALVCKLTQNQPAEVCSPVQDLINQIP